jgi:hypothetical protein
MIWSFLFKSLIHFELIFVYDKVPILYVDI